MGPAIQKSTVALAYIPSQLRFRTPGWNGAVMLEEVDSGTGRMDRESKARGYKTRIGFETPRSVPVHDLSLRIPSGLIVSKAMLHLWRCYDN